jgi:hypothetical protein
MDQPWRSSRSAAFRKQRAMIEALDRGSADDVEVITARPSPEAEDARQ